MRTTVKKCDHTHAWSDTTYPYAYAQLVSHASPSTNERRPHSCHLCARSEIWDSPDTLFKFHITRKLCCASHMWANSFHGTELLHFHSETEKQCMLFSIQITEQSQTLHWLSSDVHFVIHLLWRQLLCNIILEYSSSINHPSPSVWVKPNTPG